MRNYAGLFLASASLFCVSLLFCPFVLVAGTDIDIAEGETATVTAGTIANFTLGAGNHLDDLGSITAEEDSYLFEGVTSPVAVVVDSATGEVRFENVGTITATNTDGNACGILNNTAGVTIRVDGTATGTVTATGTKTAGTDQTYVQGFGGKRRDYTSKLIGSSFNINVYATSNGNEAAYAKGLRSGIVELTNLVGDIEARATSENKDANVSAIDCRTTGTFGTIFGDITSIAQSHNAAGVASEAIAAFGIYGATGISIETLDASSTITATAYSDTLNSLEGSTSFRNLTSYGLETWHGDININQLDGTINTSARSNTSTVATVKGICAREGDLTILNMSGTVRAIGDTVFAEDSTTTVYAIDAYDESATPTKGNLTLTSSGVIEAIAPRSSKAYAIFAGNVGDVTLLNGSKTTGQVVLMGDSSSLRLEKGATLTNTGNSALSYTLGTWVNGDVTNDGTIIVTGKNAVGVYVKDSGSTLTNTGTIKADGASSTAIWVHGGVATHSGSIITSNGATACNVDSGGEFVLSGSSTNSISGDVELDNGTLRVSNGKWTLSELNAQNDSIITVRNDKNTDSGSQLAIGKLSLHGSTINMNLSSPLLRSPLPSSTVAEHPEDANIVNIASFATSNQIDGHLVAGKNAILSLGTSSSQDAITAINDTGLWGASGASAVLYIGKPYTLTAGSSLHVDGTLTSTPATPTNPDATFGANSLLIINAKTIPEGGAAITSTSTARLTVDPGAYLQILRAAPGTIKVAEFAPNLTSGWSLSNIYMRNVLLYPESSSLLHSFTVTLGLYGSAAVFGAEGSTAKFLDDYTIAGMTGSLTSASERFMDSLLTSADSDAAYNVEKAANLAGFGGVGHIAYDITKTSRSLTSRRIPASGSSLLYRAKDLKEQQNDIYVTPLYQYSRVKSIKTGHFSNSFSTNIYGLAIGAETASEEYLLGAAVNFGKADTDGSKASSGFFTNNDYVSVLVYGAYILPEDFQLKGELIYVNLESDISSQDFSGDADGSVYSVGLECSRPIEYKSVILTPYMGLDYAYYRQDSYSSSNSDGKLFKVDSADMSTCLLPLGMTLTKKFDTDSGWRFNANIDAGVTFAFGETDLRTDAKLVDSSFSNDISLTTDIADPVTGNLQVGMAVEKGPVTFMLDLNGNISEHSTYRGAMVKCALTF
ncbi:hypothetical protein ACQ0P8_04515 [Halodesulfovibrio aestuarii]|uniref:Autotransporter domain-containing protein n=1 Tax=Halodesulfovibrio aestuarii TaxID=126333 RepID=A0A8G2C868_9BACT|nr:autotransporter outer membrane beta-barrel domain-containing protein [Halodesulfovibrio aestuarii]SHI77031.1 hypothetical protein SAMN05660830_00929 [Halodesulfovibrio aestuarii]